MEDTKEGLLPMPDDLKEMIEKINVWDKSYDDSKNPDGSPLSSEQKLEATRQQIRIIYLELVEMGRPQQQVVETLKQEIQTSFFESQKPPNS